MDTLITTQLCTVPRASAYRLTTSAYIGAFCGLQNTPKCLVGWGGDTRPMSYPTLRLRCLDSLAFSARHLVTRRLGFAEGGNAPKYFLKSVLKTWYFFAAPTAQPPGKYVSKVFRVFIYAR